MLAKGLTRYVFGLGRRHVLKIPRMDADDVPDPTLTDRWKRLLLGLLGNIQEADHSRQKCAGLCPVVASLPLGFAVVMRRAEVCSAETFDEGSAKAVVDRCRELGQYVPAELKPDSWGWLDGRLVAIDYG